ncbi:MAG: hypothetical protein R3B91_12660 [Planctomycetaceae bacterium]
MKWAHDVLSRYFQVVADVPQVAEARLKFEEFGYDESGAHPEHVSLTCETSPEVQAFESKTCWSCPGVGDPVRWFLQKPVPREMIDVAIEVAGQGPECL